MKHLIILASIAVLAMGAAACTREKPTEVPTLVAVKEATAAPGTTPGGAATLTILTTGATDTPTPLPTAIATSIPTAAPTAIATSTPTAAPTSPLSTPSSAPGTYTVQWGDWLNKIAARFGVSTQALQAANPGIDPNRIYPGQVLNIPGAGASASPTPGPVAPPAPTGPTTYTVQRGDWIYAIARKFGVTVPALLAANPGINPNSVYPGQVLNVPGSGAPGPIPPGPSGGYTVQPGDTLFSIAVRFHTTTYALQIANHLANPNFIYPGQALIIPN